jgi:nucleotide-binding universal stress UspA family protein
VIDRAHAQEALADFQRARRRADLRSLLRAVTRRDDTLLNYDDVRRRLRAVETSLPTLADVPLDAIVGSVGRYNDFTREFLPRVDGDKERWVGVRVAMSGFSGTPPVELYRIGDAYFVKDGNHRVSVARQLGAPTIQAYVTPVRTRVPLSPSATPDDLILAEEHSRFLEETGLDLLRPDADVRLTAPGGYDALREHIAVHRYFMGLERQAEIDAAEAVAHWYDAVYASVLETIRATGVLRGFPGRTEADLYLWLSEHRGRLADDLGFALPSEAIAEHLVQALALDETERDAVLESVRRRRRDAAAPAATLVEDVLVVVEEGSEAWAAVEQAIVVATREGARLYGLHVQGRGSEGAAARVLRERFVEACEAAGVDAQFTEAVGVLGAHVRERLPWFDLVVLPLTAHAGNGGRRIDGDVAAVLRGSARPVLATPGRVSRFAAALVAYDGSRKAEEALFAAAYLGAKWDTRLVVVTVDDLARTGTATLDEARATLERYDLAADYVLAAGNVADAVVEVASERGCDLVVLGSSRAARVVESVVGGTLVRTLLHAQRPVLVV